MARPNRRSASLWLALALCLAVAVAVGGALLLPQRPLPERVQAIPPAVNPPPPTVAPATAPVVPAEPAPIPAPALAAEPLALPADEHTVEPAKIAIIIDDIGDQWAAGRRSVLLAGDVTLALLPFTPYAQRLAALAEQHGKELMLHAPMEPEAHRSWKSGLESHMDEQAIRTELRLMLASLPAVKGVNNHMGSALTQRSDTMAWVMEELVEHDLYFIDSRTSARSTALQQAQRFALASAKRDVFLDNSRAPAAIAEQFQKLLTKARAQGAAIAIGHPYPETLAFLESALPALAASGVQLVPVSALLKPNQPTMPSAAVRSETLHLPATPLPAAVRQTL